MLDFREVADKVRLDLVSIIMPLTSRFQRSTLGLTLLVTLLALGGINHGNAADVAPAESLKSQGAQVTAERKFLLDCEMLQKLGRVSFRLELRKRSQLRKPWKSCGLTPSSAT